MPKDLISVDEVPEHAGLMYFTGYSFETAKVAPILKCKKQVDALFLCKRLSSREEAARVKIRDLSAELKRKEALIKSIQFITDKNKTTDGTEAR